MSRVFAIHSSRLCNLYQRRLLLPPHAHTLRKFTSNDNTYYDSQSGMHVAIDNENEISLFAVPSTSSSSSSSSSSQSALLDLESSSELIPKIEDRLQSIMKSGFHGVSLTNSSATATATAIAIATTTFGANISMPSEEFRIFVPAPTSSTSTSSSSTEPHPKNLHFTFKFNNEAGNDDLSQSLTKYVTEGTKTVIQIDNYIDPILVANGVATLIDATGGGELILLSSRNSNSNQEDVDTESIINLCEELSYLDIPGQIMKSRLIVDLTIMNNNADDEEETLEECLTMGLNKFLICETKFDWFNTMLQEHDGKSLKDMI